MQLSTLINQSPIQCKTNKQTQKRGETTRFNVIRQNCLRPRAAVRSINPLYEKKRVQWIPKPKINELGSSSANLSPLQSSQEFSCNVFHSQNNTPALLFIEPYRSPTPNWCRKPIGVGVPLQVYVGDGLDTFVVQWMSTWVAGL